MNAGLIAIRPFERSRERRELTSRRYVHAAIIGFISNRKERLEPITLFCGDASEVENIAEASKPLTSLVREADAHESVP